MTTPKARPAGLALIAARCGRFILGLMAPAWAGFYKGVAAYNSGDYATALRELRPLAEQGMVDAQLNLAVMYNNGEGVPQDYTEAERWYRKAAEKRYAEAQFSIGLMYYKGLGVPQDYAEAVKWYRKAAEQGYARAQNDLGVMYYDGHGLPQDYAHAYKWFNLAASRFPAGEGRDIAVKNRGIAAERMTPAPIAEAERLAAEWKPGDCGAEGSPTKSTG